MSGIGTPGRGAAVLAVLLLAACSRVEPIRGCEARGPARPVCGFQNPEDLVPLPDGQRLLVSEFGAMDGTRPGRLSVLELATDARTVVYEGGAGTPTPGWGDASCPGPPSPAFSPHGIDLARRADGRLALLVVNHGGREAIELFEVVSDGTVSATWRGCAVPPPEAFLNDVASLPDGGFVTTHMYDRSGGYLGLGVRLLFGRNTGYVLEWQPGRGFARVPGTDDRFPNGITAARDGKSIYLNASMGDTVRRIERATGRELGRASVQAPDNVSWGDGRLLVASIRAGVRRVMACDGIQGGACPTEFAIVALDPETLAERELYAGNGPPMGGGTAAVERDGELVIGSFAGDRVLRVRLQ
ncbi:MAG TPA: hypothetical protein VKA21_08950 [Candidatus Binatia bacterium]|nr:hypothetical protein [Candidatus Binatia bacterium]